MESLATVYEADSQLEASVIENLLTTNGLECTTRNIGLPGVFGGGTANPVMEQYQVMVKDQDKSKAEQIILDYHEPSEE